MPNVTSSFLMNLFLFLFQPISYFNTVCGKILCTRRCFFGRFEDKGHATMFHANSAELLALVGRKLAKDKESFCIIVMTKLYYFLFIYATYIYIYIHTIVNSE